MQSLVQDSTLTQYFNVLVHTDSVFVAAPKPNTKYLQCLSDCQNMIVLNKKENEFIGRYHNVAVVLLDNKLICKPLA